MQLNNIVENQLKISIISKTSANLSKLSLPLNAGKYKNHVLFDVVLKLELRNNFHMQTAND